MQKSQNQVMNQNSIIQYFKNITQKKKIAKSKF